MTPQERTVVERAIIYLRQTCKSKTAVACGCGNCIHADMLNNLLLPIITLYDNKPYDFGDLYTIEEFIEDCKSGGLIDYDGSGHPMKDGMMSMMDVYPSRLDLIPADATHILWFNK